MPTQFHRFILYANGESRTMFLSIKEVLQSKNLGEKEQLKQE